MEPFEGHESGLVDAFAPVVRQAMREELGSEQPTEVEAYLSGLMAKFAHTDRIFSLRDLDGKPILAVSEMLAEGDVRLNADSFERERQVHQHVGDFLLFWSGLYPEFLRQLKLRVGADLICDYRRQAKESYHVVSTFDYPPFDAEAPLFRRLSDEFEAYVHCLSVVGRKLGRA